MAASEKKTPLLPALRRGPAFAVLVALSLMFAFTLSVEPALAQADDDQSIDSSPAAEAQSSADAPSVDAAATNSEAPDASGSADSANAASSNVVSNNAASKSEGGADEAAAKETEEPTDKYQASIVVGEDQQREYNGAALSEDEYYVAVVYDGSDEDVRYYTRDKDDVSGFVFLTAAGEPLDQPPANAGVYQIRAQILATSKHAGRTLEDTFEITKKIVPVPTLKASCNPLIHAASAL